MDGSSVRTVDLAVVPKSPFSPNRRNYALLGAVAGMLLSCAVVVLRELLNEQITSEDELLQAYGLPVLAAIPDMLAVQAGKTYGAYHSYYAKAAERKKKT